MLIPLDRSLAGSDDKLRRATYQKYHHGSLFYSSSGGGSPGDVGLSGHTEGMRVESSSLNGRVWILLGDGTRRRD